MIDSNTEKPLLLLVDDSVENLQVLSALLKDKYKIKIAKNGRKALEILEQQPLPDLILLDVVMPELNGFDTCEIIKNTLAWEKIPVIFLTALNEVADETAGFKSGGADFITKPFNPDIVLARINTHISLQAERRKSEQLLRVLLPEKVVSDLIRTGKYVPEIHPNVSILFSDFINFTGISEKMPAQTLIDELSSIFSEFDDICFRNKVTRIKTIGDAYMAVSGLENVSSEQSSQLVQTGLDFIEFLKKRNEVSRFKWECRIGIHSGSVIGGIVGKTRFVYDIMGDAVNVASRVESNAFPMKVTITEETASLLGDRFKLTEIGKVELKGKGLKQLYTAEK